MIQIILANNGISFNGTSYPNNTLSFRKVERANIEYIQIRTLENNIVIEAPYDEFVNSSNVPYTTADDVITELELNNVSAGGAGNFIKIASGQVDLGTAQNNTLTYESGITALNSVETRLVITRENGTDTYDANVQPEVLGTCQISIDSGCVGTVTIEIQPSATQLVNINNAGGDPIGTIADVIAYILSHTQNGWTSANLFGNIITFTEPIGQGGTHNGNTLSVNQAGGTLSTSGVTAVSGGIPASTGANYNFKDDATILKQKSSSNFTNLPNMTTTSQKLMEIIDDDTLFSGAGNKSFNVTAATGSQFLINVEVWGIKTS